MERHRNLPALRRETVLPSDSVDLYGQAKTLRENDGQLIRWKRLPGQGWISGVCAGLAYRFGMKPWKVRLTFVLGAFLLCGFTVAYYVLATAFVRRCRRLPKDFDSRTA